MRNNPATALGTCIAAVLIAMAAHAPTDSISAAMKRWRVDDSRNEFFTLFRYTPVAGLGYQEGVRWGDSTASGTRASRASCL